LSIEEWIIAFLPGAMRAATPLIFAALGVLLAERSGVLMIGVEGAMLLGALFSIVVALLTGDAWLGFLFAGLVGAAAGLFLGGLTVRLPTDQVVVGIAFNLVVLGLTSFVFRLLGPVGVYRIAPPIPTLELSIMGAVFPAPPLTGMALSLTLITWVLLFRTGPGLKLRAMGERAHAAHAAGIDVVRSRIVVLVLAGVLCAFGGAALTVGWVRVFTENITLGRGFIALAAVYFGRWHPGWALAGCLLFGMGDALALRLQAAGGGGTPFYLMTIPYLLTLVVVGITGKAVGPQDAGKPYGRG